MEDKVTVISSYKGVQFEVHHYSYYQEYELLGVVYKRFYEVTKVIDQALEYLKVK